MLKLFLNPWVAWSDLNKHWYKVLNAEEKENSTVFNAQLADSLHITYKLWEKPAVH